MRIVADAEVAAWLATSPSVQWDAGNQSKSRIKHGYEADDIEAVLSIAPAFAGRITEPAHDEPRYLVLGVTADGRHAALVFTRRGDLLRPISCRAMRAKERKAYDGI